jgi:hypothetical protein
MRKLAFLMVVSFMLVGCGGGSQNVQQTSTNQSTTSPKFVIPAYVVWNNHKYATKGEVQTVGQQLGVTSFPIKDKVFSVPGKSSNKEIAYEVDEPSGSNATYMIADRVGN